MAAKMRLGDALVAGALARWAPTAERFVSWDAKHYEGKLATRWSLRSRLSGSACERSSISPPS